MVAYQFLKPLMASLTESYFGFLVLFEDRLQSRASFAGAFRQPHLWQNATNWKTVDTKPTTKTFYEMIAKSPLQNSRKSFENQASKLCRKKPGNSKEKETTIYLPFRPNNYEGHNRKKRKKADQRSRGWCFKKAKPKKIGSVNWKVVFPKGG